MQYLIITSKTGLRGYRFPLNNTTFEIRGKILLVTSRRTEFWFSLNHYDYKVESIVSNRKETTV